MQPIKKLLSTFLMLLIVPLVAFASMKLWVSTASRKTKPVLRVSAGIEGEQRFEFARALQTIACEKQLPMQIDVSTEGSVDAYELKNVSYRKLDAAIIHGGMGSEPGVYQAAALITESLHLLVRPNLANGGLLGLEHQRFELGEVGSGVRCLAEKVVNFANIKPKPDPAPAPIEAITPVDTSGEKSPDERPDAIFVLGALPSATTQKHIELGNYTLMEIPIAEAMVLKNRDVQKVEIPQYTYQYNPAIPKTAMKTVGTRLLLVVREGLDEELVCLLLAAIYEGDFARRINLPQLDEGELSRNPEYPLCSATYKFLARHTSILTSENVQTIESLHNLALGALAVLAFPLAFLARAIWPGSFASHLKKADALRRQFDSVRAAPDEHPPIEKLTAIREGLRQLRRDITTEYAHGRLRSKDQFDRVIAYVFDLENQLAALISSFGYTIES